MAAFLGTATTAEIALTAATAKTALQLIAASNHLVRILSWSATLDGIAPTDPAVVLQLVRQTTAGTMSANTPKKLNDSLPETLQTTAQDNATVEPTATDVLDTLNIHPQLGYKTPYGYEVLMGGGDRLGWKLTAPDAVNVIITVHFEE